MSASFDRDGMARILKAQVAAKDCSSTAQKFLFTGIDGKDIDTFIDFSFKSGYLIVVRAPHEHANASSAPPKSFKVKAKTSSNPEGEKTGEIRDPRTGTLMRSDYDLMSIYKISNKNNTKTYSKIVANWTPGREMTSDERSTILLLNRRLISKIQHGCNDDWVNEDGSPKNKTVGNDFVVFNAGNVIYLDFISLKKFYEKLGFKFHDNYSPVPPAGEKKS